MIGTWVTVLTLVSSFSDGPEVKQLSGVSEIVINGLHTCYFRRHWKNQGSPDCGFNFVRRKPL